tara:strand:- start:1294 stop:1518 length:225 start_codon:yes stop_codon:yes gene_type:complete
MAAFPMLRSKQNSCVAANAAKRLFFGVKQAKFVIFYKIFAIFFYAFFLTKLENCLIKSNPANFTMRKAACQVFF